MERYPRESHPFFLVRKASLLVSLGGGAIAVNLYMTVGDVYCSLYVIAPSNINQTRPRIYCPTRGSST